STKLVIQYKEEAEPAHESNLQCGPSPIAPIKATQHSPRHRWITGSEIAEVATAKSGNQWQQWRQ
ncbi:MAG: hypothetical protein MJA30_16345, partial [Cytophagales bacterium]|nr:hypothetical protein [Cytophagales bacterium]